MKTNFKKGDFKICVHRKSKSYVEVKSGYIKDDVGLYLVKGENGYGQTTKNWYAVHIPSGTDLNKFGHYTRLSAYDSAKIALTRYTPERLEELTRRFQNLLKDGGADADNAN